MNKKFIMPIIVTLLIFSQLTGFIAICILLPVPIWIRILGVVILLALLGIAIAMFVERVREIESGEEDDLDRY